MRLDRQDGRQHRVGAAEPEAHEMMQAEGEQVARMVAQDAFPDRRGAGRLAVDPGFERGEMRLLARRGAGAETPRFGQRLHRHRHDRLLEREHGEMTLVPPALPALSYPRVSHPDARVP